MCLFVRMCLCMCMSHVVPVGRLSPHGMQCTNQSLRTSIWSEAETSFTEYGCPSSTLMCACSGVACSGMPECKLGLNDRVLLEAQGRAAKGKAIDLDDIKFHQWVH